MLLDGRCIKGVYIRVLLSSRIEMQKTVEMAVQQTSESSRRSDNVGSRYYETMSCTNKRARWNRSRRQDRFTDLWTRRNVGGSHSSRSSVANKVAGDGVLERSRVSTRVEECLYEYNNLVRRQRMTAIDNRRQQFRTVSRTSVVSSTSRFRYDERNELTWTDGRSNFLSTMTYEWTTTGTWLWARRNIQLR